MSAGDDLDRMLRNYYTQDECADMEREYLYDLQEMESEIKVLKSRIAELKRENEQLREDIKEAYRTLDKYGGNK